MGRQSNLPGRQVVLNQNVVWSSLVPAAGGVFSDNLSVTVVVRVVVRHTV